MKFMRRTRFLNASLSLAALALNACDYEWQKRQQASAAEARIQERVANAAQRDKGGDGRSASGRVGGNMINRTTGERLSRLEDPFVTTRGFLVRGTDEASFVICGSRTVHYARVSPLIAQRVTQYYRFRAPQLLYPVFFEVRGRVVPDTVSIGPNTYTSVLEISAVDIGKMGEPTCSPPASGSLIAANRFD